MQFFVSWRVIIKRIKAIRFMMADKTVFPFGFIDDLVLWIFILYTLKETLDTYWMGEKPVNYSKKYKDAIEQDDFEVVKDDDFEVMHEESPDGETASEETRE